MAGAGGTGIGAGIGAPASAARTAAGRAGWAVDFGRRSRPCRHPNIVHTGPFADTSMHEKGHIRSYRSTSQHLYAQRRRLNHDFARLRASRPYLCGRKMAADALSLSAPPCPLRACAPPGRTLAVRKMAAEILGLSAPPCPRHAFALQNTRALAYFNGMYYLCTLFQNDKLWLFS